MSRVVLAHHEVLASIAIHNPYAFEYLDEKPDYVLWCRSCQRTSAESALLQERLKRLLAHLKWINRRQVHSEIDPTRDMTCSTQTSAKFCN